MIISLRAQSDTKAHILNMCFQKKFYSKKERVIAKGIPRCSQCVLSNPRVLGIRNTDDQFSIQTLLKERKTVELLILTSQILNQLTMFFSGLLPTGVSQSPANIVVEKNPYALK